MNKRSCKVYIGSLLLLVALIDGYQAFISSSKHNPALIVVKGIRTIGFGNNGGCDQMQYFLKEKYPARRVLKYIALQLQRQGWRPLEEDFLNPGRKSSNVTGWSSFTADNPEREVRLWSADWEKDGNIVTYGLRYQCSINSRKQPDQLEVVATYTPRRIASQTKKFIMNQTELTGGHSLHR